jgi:hypothetical protein
LRKLWILLSALLVTGFFLLGWPSPAFSSSGQPSLFVTSNQTAINAGGYQDAASSVSLPGGAELANLVDSSPPSVSPAYFAVNMTGVTFSGAQFYLLLSTNGFSQRSSSDIQFAGPFNVASLSSPPALVGSYYIGMANGTKFISGPIASGEAGGPYYVKVWDGNSASVAVSLQLVVIQPAITISATSGAAGQNLVLTGFGFSAGHLVNITIQNSASSPTRIYYTRNITASPDGNFTWSLSNDSSFSAPDLGLVYNGNPVIQPEGTAFYWAFDWQTMTGVSAQAYSEQYRVFPTVLAFDPNLNSYVPPSGSGPYGNGTAITAFIGRGFNITGNFFNPTSPLNFYLNNTPVSPVAIVQVNGTGYFMANFTIPALQPGFYAFRVADATNNMTIVLQVKPTAYATVGINMSYTVLGGGSGYSPPTLDYMANGLPQTAVLTTTPVTYLMDPGTTWSVTNPLAGSSLSESWKTNQVVTGTASSNSTINFVYYHQYNLSFAYGIWPATTPLPPGGPLNPSIQYIQFGQNQSTTIGIPVWADAGSTYTFQNPIAGTSAGERYDASTPSGTVTSSGLVQVTYFHQYQLTFAYAVVGGGTGFQPPSVQYTSLNQNVTVTAMAVVWADSGTPYSYPSVLAGSGSSERWAAASALSGLATSSTTVTVVYDHQFYVTLTSASVQGGGVSPSSGWFNAGSIIQIVASASTGWKFSSWTGSGNGSYSGPGTGPSIIVSSPISETANFDPGLTITSGNGGSVLYSYGTVSGSVPPGSTSTIYAPPGTQVTLTAVPSSILYGFTAWNASTGLSGSSVSVTLNAPYTATASFGLNFVTISVIVIILVVVIIMAVVLLRRSAKPSGV